MGYEPAAAAAAELVGPRSVSCPVHRWQAASWVESSGESWVAGLAKAPARVRQDLGIKQLRVAR